MVGQAVDFVQSGRNNEGCQCWEIGECREQLSVVSEREGQDSHKMHKFWRAGDSSGQFVNFVLFVAEKGEAEIGEPRIARRDANGR